MISDAIISEIRFSLDPANNNGRLRVEVDFVARGPLTRDSAIVAAAVDASTGSTTADFFHFSDILTCIGGGTNYQPLSFTARIKNNAAPVSQDIADLSRFLTWGLKNYESEMMQTVVWIAGLETAPIDVIKEWDLSWLADDTDGHLLFEFEGKQTLKNIVAGDVNGVEATLNTYNTTFGGARITLADAVDHTW